MRLDMDLVWYAFCRNEESTEISNANVVGFRYKADNGIGVGKNPERLPSQVCNTV